MQDADRSSNSPQPKLSFVREIIPSAVVSLLIPVAGYYAAYKYEIGFCRYWQIPAGLIRLDITNLSLIATAAISLFIMLIGAESFARGVLAVLPETPRNRIGIITKNLAPLFILSFILLAYNLVTFPFNEIWIVCLVLLILILAYILLLLYALRKKPTAHAKITHQKNKAEPEKAPDQDIPSILYYVLGRRTATIVMLTILLSAIADSTGTAAARRQADYYKKADQQELVVIKIYGTNMIAKHLDYESGKLVAPIELLPYEAGISLIPVTKKELGLK